MANISSIFYVIGKEEFGLLCVFQVTLFCPGLRRTGVNMSNAYTQSLSTTFKMDDFVSIEICILAATIQSVMGNKMCITTMFTSDIFIVLNQHHFNFLTFFEDMRN
jgi:hypothetical protein